MPAFHSLIPVRDEEDIIGECLEHTLTWADTVHVFDTGSIDQTWEIVNEMALKDKRIKPVRKDSVYFSDTVGRGWLFHQARKTMRDGDWFLRADADEFHHIPPPEFVKTHLRKCETVVWRQYFNFCLMESEAASLDSKEAILRERQKPIFERRTFYWVSDYSEPRLCRYRASMKWPVTASFPFNAGFVAKARLPIRHYPHRDPLQSKRRCSIRAAMHECPQRGVGSYELWSVQDWREFLTADSAQGLKRWAPGEDLPDPQFVNHLAPLRKRIPQFLLHSFMVRYLDSLRKGWRDGVDEPAPLPKETLERLQNVFQGE